MPIISQVLQQVPTPPEPQSAPDNMPVVLRENSWKYSLRVAAQPWVVKKYGIIWKAVSFATFLTAVAPAPMPKWQKCCISGCFVTGLTVSDPTHLLCIKSGA